jgi:hypothetical protein
MTPRRFPVFVLLLALPCIPAPAFGVSKEIIELQTQVQQLQEQMTSMQRSFDERMGVMKNLVEQDTDAVNKVAASMSALQSTLQKQQADSAGHVDQLSGQLQSLNDTLDELKARLAKVSKQLEDMQPNKARPRPPRNSNPSNKPRRRLRRPTFSTTTRCATTTAPRTISRCRNFPITSSSIPTPTLPETVTSIWEKFSFARAITSRPRKTMTRFCRIFPAEAKWPPRN